MKSQKKIIKLGKYIRPESRGTDGEEDQDPDSGSFLYFSIWNSLLPFFLAPVFIKEGLHPFSLADE